MQLQHLHEGELPGVVAPTPSPRGVETNPSAATVVLQMLTYI